MTHPHAVPVSRERPILFSAPMVRAILAGTKTQTRRIAKLPPGIVDVKEIGYTAFTPPGHVSVRGYTQGPRVREFGEWFLRNPHGQPGDRLWVRETWTLFSYGETERERLRYRADYRPEEYAPFHPVWRPSIHMPRWASRITLEVTGVRAERVRDISHDDALAEGVKEWAGDRLLELRDQPLSLPQIAFSHLWDEVNGPGAWERNEWVWVVSFRRVEPQTPPREPGTKEG